MINILIVHPTLSPPFGRGGVETVLISYLKILSKFVTQEKCKVDLLLLKEITEDDLAIIPKNINATFNFRGLSVFEEMFQIYCSIVKDIILYLKRNSLVVGMIKLPIIVIKIY